MKIKIMSCEKHVKMKIMPARMYGGGIRSSLDVAPAAFIGPLCRSVPQFLDQRDQDWNVRHGFLPVLQDVLGNGAFDDTTTSP